MNVARFEIDGRMVEAPCRECWQCRANRVHDWVGRCIAEKEHAVAASFVTLTYGGSRHYGSAGDTAGAQVFRYADVQGWIRKFRDAGFPVRFVLASEMGARKGRIHHHAILFWQAAKPTLNGKRDGEPMPDGVYQDSDPWWIDADGKSRGRTQWDPVTPKSIRYVCKYILKPDGIGAASMFRMSKRPAIGARYFMDRAERYVAQQLSPQNALYSFPEYRGRNRMPRPLLMTNATRDLFVRHFVNRWKAVYGDRPWPHSELVADYVERIRPPDGADPKVAADPEGAKRRYRDDREAEIERLGQEARTRIAKRRSPPLSFPAGFSKLRFEERLNLWACEVAGRRLVWSYDDNGQAGWATSPCSEAEAERRRNRAAKALPPPEIRLGRKPAGPKRSPPPSVPDRDELERVWKAPDLGAHKRRP